MGYISNKSFVTSRVYGHMLRNPDLCHFWAQYFKSTFCFTHSFMCTMLHSFGQGYFWISDFYLLFFSDIHPESFNLQWFFNDSCAPPTGFNKPTSNDTLASGWRASSFHFDSEENKHRLIHFSVFLGLLLVGILEVLFGLSQIVIGFLGCLCGVSKRRSQIV